MSIIAEALKKAQRKSKKGGDIPPPFELGKDKGKAPVRGATPSRAPRAKPVSAASSAEAVKSIVGAGKPVAATKQAAAKTTPKATPAKKKKVVSPAGKIKLWQQRKVRMAIMAVSVVTVFAAVMYYVNNVYLPEVAGGGMASAPAPPVTTPAGQQAAVELAVQDPAEQAETGQAEGGQEQTTGELAVPPVPELEQQQAESSLAGMDEPQPPEMNVSPESRPEQAGVDELAVDEPVVAVPGRSMPPAGAVPPSIINKGEQEKPLREDIYHFNMAVYFQRKGAVREALGEYEEVIRLSPHNAEVYSNMGVLYNQIGEFEEAVAVLQKALLIDPRYSKARNNMAVAYYRAGQYEQALEQAGRAIEIESGNLDALSNMGLIYRKMDKPELAEQSFRRALAVDTGYSAAHYNLALLFEQTGQLAQAARHYRSFLAAGEGSEQLNAKVRGRLQELSPG